MPAFIKKNCAKTNILNAREVFGPKITPKLKINVINLEFSKMANICAISNYWKCIVFLPNIFCLEIVIFCLNFTVRGTHKLPTSVYIWTTTYLPLYLSRLTCGKSSSRYCLYGTSGKTHFLSTNVFIVT